jgi:hypothetical protein
MKKKLIIIAAVLGGILATLLIVQTVVRASYYNNVVKPWIQKAFKDGDPDNDSRENLVYYGEGEYSADVFFKRWPSISGNWAVTQPIKKFYNVETKEEGYMEQVCIDVDVFYCINEPMVLHMSIMDCPGGSYEHSSYQLDFDEEATLISADEESLKNYEKYKENIEEALGAVKYFFDIPKDR